MQALRRVLAASDMTSMPLNVNRHVGNACAHGHDCEMENKNPIAAGFFPSTPSAPDLCFFFFYLGMCVTFATVASYSIFA